MAVELSEAKGSVKEAAEELGINPARISKRKNQHNSTGNSSVSTLHLSEEQNEIRRLQKELREAESRSVIS
jgi:transposase